MKTPFFIPRIIGQVTKLLLDGKYILLFMTLWFVISFIVGYATAKDAIVALKKDSSIQEVRWLKPILHPEIKYQRTQIKDPRLFQRTLSLFLRNTLAMGITLYLGSLLIFIPFFSIFVHGWLCGALFEQAGYHILARRLIPHVFLELPVMLLIASISTLLAKRFYQEMKDHTKRSFLNVLRDASITYIVCIPVLFVSAFFENYGTRILWG